jgi:hypothetical protein
MNKDELTVLVAKLEAYLNAFIEWESNTQEAKYPLIAKPLDIFSKMIQRCVRKKLPKLAEFLVKFNIVKLES